MLESHGASRILASFHDIVPNWIFAGLYFSNDFLAQHPDHVQKVLKGLVLSFDFIASHEKEARSFLPKYTHVEEDLCMIAALREYAPVEPIERINEQADLMVTYGFIKNKVALDPMIDYRFVPEELKKIGRSTPASVK
jgi:ABC-type nitrate/sulfonate/bicarbonate transport system substrate-binding protein